MSKRISQEHFDEVVLENINDLEMTPEEALEDAMEQFKAQDVNLTLIVADAETYEGGVLRVQPVLATLSLIAATPRDTPTTATAAFTTLCADFIRHCSGDINIRCLAGNNDAVKILLQYVEDPRHTNICLQSLISVCNGNPDILTSAGVVIFMRLLKTTKDVHILELALKLIRTTCVMQESNRLMYLEENIISIVIDDVMPAHEDSPPIVHESCQVLINLTLDDDIRVPFGKGTQNVVTIVGNGKFMKYLSKLCKNNSSNVNMMNILYRTMACLATKNEYCYHVMSSGMLGNIMNTMHDYHDETALMKQCLVLLKAIAGNDDVKIAIADVGLLQIIVEVMTKYLMEPTIVKNANAAIGAAVLRQTRNCDIIMNTCFTDTVVKAMTIHRKNAAVLIQCATAIRNLLSRCPEHRECFLSAGAEDLLRAMCSIEEVAEIATSALRDLGLKVTFNERWKGEGHQIDRD